MNHKLSTTILAIALLAMSSCVKRKLYQAEILTRKGAEGQVSALAKELHDRKRENSNLIKEIGELNRQIGGLQKEMTDLHAELAKRTESMGASTEKLLAEKHELEVKLNATAKTLESKENQLNSLTSKQQAAQQQLSNDFGALETALTGINGNGVTLNMATDHIECTVADQMLFAPESTKLSASAAAFMNGFAQFLSERPAYKVQIHAHVDNLVPARQRDLTDTWSYAQARALNITRMLVNNYNVNAYMLAPVARGEYQPISTNSTPQGRAENRRTIFYIYPDFN
jgi:chemotaxis protein MotB